MAAYYELSKEELRDVIFGRIQYRKCPACDNDGVEWYNGKTGDAARPFPDPSWGKWTESQECPECDGLGFVPFYVYQNNLTTAK